MDSHDLSAQFLQKDAQVGGLCRFFARFACFGVRLASKKGNRPLFESQKDAGESVDLGFQLNRCGVLVIIFFLL